ncbi:unnamed protein product [Caenorhabditis sp. 36 PRJEB53466]|nr:unnamed protein product [Caenorhabditis sp. 36 PRJEB53466]
MDILKWEIRGSEHVLLSISVATSALLWGWTFWRNQGEKDEHHKRSIRADSTAFHTIRSPGSPRTREAFKKRGCACKLISARDDCRQNKQKNRWNGSDEEENDTDMNLIPSSMRSKKQVMLNR